MKQKVKNQPVYLGFASQKGGVGKSSLAEILASILYYEKGISLLVVDCDGTQESFFKLRQRERRVIEGSETISKQMKVFFTKFGKHAYPIIRSTPKNVITYVNEYIRTHDIKVNLVIFDFPGHASTEDLLQLSIDMDYIITPIEADPQSLVSSFAYARTIRDLGVGLSDARIRDLLLLWNKINRSASSIVMDYYTQYAKEEDISIFDARIYHSVRFSRELELGGVKGVFRSSYLPPALTLRLPTGIDLWVEEVIEKCHLIPDSL